MAHQSKILAFAGSSREKSFNKKLVKIAAQGARNAGADVTYLDLKDYPMPLFDEDVEEKEGMPDNAKKVKQMIADHDGFLIACPEYNGSITSLLKNVLDWASIATEKDEPPVSAFRGKVAAVMSTSPGSLGGLKGLLQIRAILEHMKVMVIPEQRAIGGAYKAFDEKDNLKDEKQQKSIERLGEELTYLLQKLNH